MPRKALLPRMERHCRNALQKEQFAYKVTDALR